ncbi:MAG: hypothetical protein LKJ69_07890 [Lactobacillus sp.]|jgi:hypothetical protein|nr:hypothetical protein [Lactobacillus sp.]MCI2033313.1 hypothetical protein [Lactobacillus sp.]
MNMIMFFIIVLAMIGLLSFVMPTSTQPLPQRAENSAAARTQKRQS